MAAQSMPKLDNAGRMAAAKKAMQYFHVGQKKNTIVTSQGNYQNYACIAEGQIGGQKVDHELDMLQQRIVTCDPYQIEDIKAHIAKVRLKARSVPANDNAAAVTGANLCTVLAKAPEAMLDHLTTL